MPGYFTTSGSFAHPAGWWPRHETEGGMDVTTGWYWEGNVVDAIARFLEADGWMIVSIANTHSKERGVDVHAVKSGRTILVEAKGFPSKSYRDPRRASEVKPTNPNNQAQQWYSHALLKALRLQTKHPDATIALDFPDFPVTELSLRRPAVGFQKWA